MTAKKLAAADVALPRFEPGDAEDGDAFSLSNHARAREALEFGLSVKGPGFNIFVLGDDHSGRMTATIDFMRDFMNRRPAPDDWLYLNNFGHPHNPKPHRLPAGVERNCRERMTALVPQVRDALMRAFGSEEYRAEVHGLGERERAELAQRMDALRAEVAEAVADDRFHLWSIGSVDEAVELFTGVPAGVPDAGGAYGADTVYGRVMAQVEAFDRILAERPPP